LGEQERKQHNDRRQEENREGAGSQVLRGDFIQELETMLELLATGRLRPTFIG
jgi:hypothetical protein